MSSLDKCLWLYDSEQEIITLPVDQVTLDDISNEYQKEDENIERLIKALGLKLDEIIEFEEKTGKKVVSVEDYELLQKFKNKQHDSEKEKQEDSWSPESEPDDAIPIVDETDFQERKQEDLSGQTMKEGTSQEGTEDHDDSEEDTNDPMKSHDPKAVGD